MAFNEIPPLRDAQGNRLYLNKPEQERFWSVITGLPAKKRLFLETLILTGPRVSESIALKAQHVDRDSAVLVFQTLKRGGRESITYEEIPGHLHSLDLGRIAREMGVSAPSRDLRLTLRVPRKLPEKPVWRHVPVPLDYLRRLHRMRDLTKPDDDRLLFPISRGTGYNWVKEAMAEARIAGPQATCHGLRHTFGVNHALVGTPIGVLQKLMGHAKSDMTQRYMDVVDDDLREILRRTWPKAMRV